MKTLTKIIITGVTVGLAASMEGCALLYPPKALPYTEPNIKVGDYLINEQENTVEVREKDGWRTYSLPKCKKGKLEKDDPKNPVYVNENAVLQQLPKNHPCYGKIKRR